MNPRLESLLNRWLDGELAPPEAEAVQRILAEDPEARRICYELLMVDRLLDERFDGIPEDTGTMEAIVSHSVAGSYRRRVRFAPFAAMAAVIALSFLGIFHAYRKPEEPTMGPHIIGSTDSRITIAQRQDAANWAIGELFRLERGTANIRLAKHVSANFEGPSAVELLDGRGRVRLLEGMASVAVRAGDVASEVHVPGGILRTLDSRYIVEVLPDGIAKVRAESGFLEVRPNDSTQPAYLKSGDSLLLEPDGNHQPIRLPDFHFRSGLPKQVALFREDFNVDGAARLAGRVPPLGQPWEVLSELNPTVIREKRLDTSSGARRVVANLLDHGKQGARAVYIVSFDLLPPEWMGDKSKRLGGVEHITLQDEVGNDIVSIVAKASNSHRWQLADDRTKASTALTQVCALWTHSLTLCYGLDGLVTLHDGATAQSPIIAELRVAEPPPAARILIGNFDGGDLALSRMEALLLSSPPSDGL